MDEDALTLDAHYGMPIDVFKLRAAVATADAALDAVCEAEHARGIALRGLEPSPHNFTTGTAGPIAVGSHVKARYLASSKGTFGTQWFSGVVTASHADGTFNITYVDGDFESNVMPAFVKPAQFTLPVLPPSQVAMDVEVAPSVPTPGAAPVTTYMTTYQDGQATAQPTKAAMADDTWVQCDECEKWRRLVGISSSELPDAWVCLCIGCTHTYAIPIHMHMASRRWSYQMRGYAFAYGVHIDRGIHAHIHRSYLIRGYAFT